MLAVILIIHDRAWSPVKNKGQLLLRQPTGFPCVFYCFSYIVEIKPSFISFYLHNIT